MHYEIAFPAPHTHLYEVTLALDSGGQPMVDLVLPAWMPGSYLVRDYARHVQQFAAEGDGAPLAWRKIDKATWRVETGGAAQIAVRYAVYAFELTVRTNHLDGTHAYFNPGTLCMYWPGRTADPCAIDVVAPATWIVTTGLAQRTVADVDAAHRRWSFEAPDYDALVDSPFECGTHRLLTFSVDAIPHEIAIYGRGNEDEARIVNDTRRIVEVERDMFGELPYTRYVFVLHLVDGAYGGLEHRNSVSNIVDRWGFASERGYEKFLGLTSHEFYHVWNVKRIRPAPLGPFDYQHENYTSQLWVSEGITSYYDDLVLLRAGLIGRERYLAILAENIQTLERQPGRALQSLAESSFDTWIKFYRPDENTTNSSISYYLKGSLAALLLDLEIRGRTEGERSLDHLLRALYASHAAADVSAIYAGPTAATAGLAENAPFASHIAAIADDPDGAYADLLRRAIETAEPLDYRRGLAHVGLALTMQGGGGAWHGLALRTENGRLKVFSARSDGPGMAAGIYAGDEIVALDSVRVDEGRLAARIEERRPGDSVVVSLFRRDDLLHIPLTLGTTPDETAQLTVDADASDAQRALLDAWLASPFGS